MNKIKHNFSIKDLENLSGIKAHTIRIWEKRYTIFNPNRTETNIRLYSNDELIKLLNISFLNSYGYKISRISNLNEKELNELVKKIYSEKNSNSHSVNILKIAMLNFDAIVFNENYHQLLQTKSFTEIFLKVYIPLLQEIGMLWHTSSLKPIHEHFISYLIIQKLIENINIAQTNVKVFASDKTFILFLPENEVHEISLMFVNYQLLEKGYKTIFLGSSIPTNNLLELNKHYSNLHFISYFTIIPFRDEVVSYLDNFYETILKNTDNKLYISGNQTKNINYNHTDSVLIFENLEELISSI